MKNDYYSYSKDYINRWVVSYADFITMLLALFMVLWAISGNNIKKMNPELIKENFKQESTNIVTNEQNEVIKELSKNKEITENAKILKSDRGVILRFNDKMLFAAGSAIIKPEMLPVLDKVAKELKKLDKKVIIEGHTDSTPISTAQYPTNWELSTARATNIIKYLITEKGLNPQKMSAVGYGEYKPIAPNTTYEGKTLNRRVDIIILDKQNFN